MQDRDFKPMEIEFMNINMGERLSVDSDGKTTEHKNNELEADAVQKTLYTLKKNIRFQTKHTMSYQ